MKDECTSVEFQLCTGQHLTSLEENFQFSAFFMEHPGSSSQNGNKRKRVGLAPSMSRIQRRLIMMFVFVLVVVIFCTFLLSLPLH